jgi:predicted Fe-Mo cluster-binding NifX family protein
MSYKVAIASSDGVNIDVSFGEAESFIIYEVENNNFKKIEERKWDNSDIDSANCTESVSCGNSNGCGNGNGCGGGGADIPKLKIVDDCRCLVCKKIGFKVRKQLEKKAVSAFDIEYPVNEALEKIAFYFDRLDNHKSLRGTAKAD